MPRNWKDYPGYDSLRRIRRWASAHPYNYGRPAQTGRRSGRSSRMSSGSTSMWNVGDQIARQLPVVGPVYAAGRTAYDIGRGVQRLFSRGTATNIPMESKAKNFSAGGGRYAGKIKPRRRVKWNFKSKAQAKGYSIHFEKGGSVTDPYCVYIGHGTCPQVLMRRIMIGCLLKTLLNRLGIAFSNTVQPLNFLTIGDIITIRYRRDQETATESTVNFTLPTNQPTFQTLVDALVNSWVLSTQGQTFQDNEQWKLVEIMFNPGGTGDLTAIRIPLENAYITFEAQSSLKLQNRSVPSDTDDNADEVDRIPVTGKIYRFSGSGTNFKRTALAAIGEINFEPVGEKQDGIFTYAAGAVGGADVLKEPPLPQNFVRCKSYNKISCNPGEIKVSTVKYKRTMHINTLMRYVVATNESIADGQVRILQKYGMFNLIAMEKLIETSNTASTQLINLAYEVDYKIFGYLSTKAINSTIGEHYYGVNPA